MKVAGSLASIWDAPSPDEKQWIPRWFDEQSDRSTPATMQAETVADKFARLAVRWKNETGGLSIVRQKAMHSAYQAIIGMGEDAIPLILRNLISHGGLWFWALEAITEDDPVADEDRGNTRKMAEEWIAWGRKRNYL